MTDFLNPLIEQIRQSQEPDVLRLKGRWVNLHADKVRNLIWPLWCNHVTGEIRSKRHSASLITWSGSQSELFLQGREWYGAIPGDAVRSIFVLLFHDASLLEFSCVDSCTETNLEILFWNGGDSLAGQAGSDLGRALDSIKE